MDGIINRACDVDHAGEALMKFLLHLPDQDLSILGF